MPGEDHHEHRQSHLAFDFQALPNAGVGLARLEFVINNMIGCTPRRCSTIEPAGDLKTEVERAARGYASPRAFFVEKLTEGVATIARILAQAGDRAPVDFKSNEYKKLVGGSRYEPDEETDARFPGVSRYIGKTFRIASTWNAKPCSRSGTTSA